MTYGQTLERLYSGWDLYQQSHRPTVKESISRAISTRLVRSQDKQPYSKYDASYINTDLHKQYALEAAEQGMVLLKNDGSALPLSKATATTSVAIIGPNGNATDTLLGNYEGVPQYKISVFEAMRREYPKCSFESGCDNVACMNTTNFANAATLASQSDVVVLVIGLDQTQESEGHDRTKFLCQESRKL